MLGPFSSGAPSTHVSVPMRKTPMLHMSSICVIV